MIRDTQAGTPPGCHLLGLDFDSLEVESAAQRVADRCETATFSYVVTPNADHLVRLSRDPSLLPLYRAASLCLLDSRVVARAARLLGLPAPVVATGSDLTSRLLEAHVRPGERVTIVGLRAAHLPALVRRTGIAAPAHYDPPMGFDRDPSEMQKAVRFVLEHPARLVFLAVGSPRQERSRGCDRRHRRGARHRAVHRRQPGVRGRDHTARAGRDAAAGDRVAAPHGVQPETPGKALPDRQPADLPAAAARAARHRQDRPNLIARVRSSAGRRPAPARGQSSPGPLYSNQGIAKGDCPLLGLGAKLQPCMAACWSGMRSGGIT